MPRPIACSERTATVVSKLEQQRIFDWLNQELGLPAFAELYHCAACMLLEKSPGYITVVAHAGRELMNSLPTAGPGGNRKQVQYRELVDTFKDDWKSEQARSVIKGITDTKNGRFISDSTCKDIDKLIEEHEEGTVRSANTAHLFFRKFLDYDKVPSGFLSEWKSAKKWFEKRAHLPSRPYSQNVSSESEKYFKALEGFLYTAATSAFERLRDIDGILAETNR